MKNLIITLILLPIIAYGGTGGVVGGDDLSKDKSWQEIKKIVKKDFELKISYAPVFLGRPISAFDTCIDGGEFKTTRKFPIYKTVRLRTGGDNDRTKTVKIGEEYLSYPITYTTKKKVCEGKEDKRCRYEEVIVNQDLTKNVSVSKKLTRTRSDRENNRYKELFTKKYDIPYCQ